MKTCSNPNCQQQNPQPLSSFCKRKKSKDGLNHWCKKCAVANNRKVYHRDIEKSRRKSREWDNTHRPHRFRSEIKHKFGITVEQYNAMLLQQHSKCKICGQEEKLKTKSGNNKRLAVDHCHSSGRIRGLLCGRCNKGIGLFKDDISLFKNIIKYLKGVSDGQEKTI